jgi:hypothetical protein
VLKKSELIEVSDYERIFNSLVMLSKQISRFIKYLKEYKKELL